LKPKFLFTVGLSCLTLVVPGYGERRRAAAKPRQSAAVQPAPTLPPLTLAQMPASAPEVSFRGGQLTISAQNSTLGDILKSVRAQTGATIDLPGNPSERVVGHFGPAPARDVLTSLLNGTHFNYLLLGSPTDPSALDRVILIAKSAPPAESSPQPNTEQANGYNQNAYPRPMAAPMAAPPGSNTVVVDGQDAEDDATDDSADATDDTQADDQTDQTDDQQAADDQQAQQTDGQPAVKTPEQLLQELQQRQQQMQQQGIQPGMQPGLPSRFPTPGLPGQPGQPGVPNNPNN
jgi:hypothetical protein